MNPGTGAGAGNLGTPESVLRPGDSQAVPRAGHPLRIEKPWGHELIWAHADEYVGKLLFVRAGEALSLQFHEEKDETLFLMGGELRLELGAGVQSLQPVELLPGQSIRIPPGVLHRMTAVTDCTLFEASTPELDDVVRVRDRYGRAPSGEPAPPVSASGRCADLTSGQVSEKSAQRTTEIPFVLALGSNLGDREENLARGLRFLGERLQIQAVSRTMESRPWGPVPQGAFLNLTLRGTGVDNPFALLDIARAAEKDAGRRRDVRYGPRTLDVDLIFFGDLMLDHPELTLPHPRWEDRPFVRNLLAEIGGTMVDPVTGRRLVDLPTVADGAPG